MSSPREYCIFLDGSKYNRNRGCKAHDNAYGINGGGSERDRWRADLALFRHMRDEGDPAALIALYFTLTCGWVYFNYHRGLWRGQLIRKFAPRTH